MLLPLCSACRAESGMQADGLQSSHDMLKLPWAPTCRPLQISTQAGAKEVGMQAEVTYTWLRNTRDDGNYEGSSTLTLNRRKMRKAVRFASSLVCEDAWHACEPSAYVFELC